MQRKLPSYFLGKNQLVGTVIFSVLFALIFLNIYIPFSDTAWFRLGNSQMFLFTAGFAFISILILVASRVVMYKVGRIVEMTYLGYVLWCILELVLICLFYTFVTTDIVNPAERQPWLPVFARAMLYGSISLIIPYKADTAKERASSILDDSKYFPKKIDVRMSPVPKSGFEKSAFGVETQKTSCLEIDKTEISSAVSIPVTKTCFSLPASIKRRAAPTASSTPVILP